MKKIPLRLYFMIIMGIFIFALSMMLLYRLFVNHDFVSKYNDGVIDVTGEEKLLEFNFPESYLPYYNLGNAAYKNGDYNSAISYYTKALENYPPEGKDCKIRINLALALCDTIDFYNLNTQEKVDTALFILYKARDVLLEKGCAVSEEGQVGHDADAQQLKEDIDRMIEKLQNPDQNQSQQQQQESQAQNDGEGSSGSESKPSDKEKRVQGELEGKKKDAMEDRKDQRGNLEKWSQYVEGEGGEKSDGTGDGGINEDISPW